MDTSPSSKGTGKGAAVIAESKAQESGEARSVQKAIPTDRIDRDPGQPRVPFDEAALRELAKSMEKLGQFQPVTVRYDASTRRYTLIMGERRWRAAQMAGLDRPEGRRPLRLGEGRETFAMAVPENVRRADMTAIEEGGGPGGRATFKSWPALQLETPASQQRGPSP
ncbi:ParB/RepB/Spo0J family partition protein [Streptomyces sp. NPDC046984]|uniref:ParB/RepB/Spo0J family partition protein n=1 Tax=Streptomyces sp. NPDC046984 TaxID=3155138 RepID=UPI0034035412